MPSRLLAGPFRGLNPYQEEDAPLFFGREQERESLLQHVSQKPGTITILSGESGVGKTSLMRAGILPRLKANGGDVYLNCGRWWRAELSQLLVQRLNRPANLQNLRTEIRELAASSQAPLVLLVDHLEQLLWLEKSDVSELGILIQSVLENQGNCVLGVDRGFSYSLEQLTYFIAEIAQSPWFIVERMTRQTASQVMEQTVLAGGGYMEPGLPEVIAEELAAEHPILPAALQITGHGAILEHATRIKTYNRAGGALAMTKLYVERLIARAGEWQARRILAVLSEHPNPRHAISLSDIAQSCGLESDKAQVVLQALVRQGLTTSINSGNAQSPTPHYAILHPFLVQPIRDSVAAVHRGRTRAKISLQRRLHGGGILRPDEILRIRRYLGNAINAPEQDQLRRSKRIWTVVFASLLALPLLLIIFTFALLNSSSYLSTAPGFPQQPRVVVRSGRPALDFTFGLIPGGFGEITIDTGFLSPYLPDPLQRQIKQQELVTAETMGGKSLPPWLGKILTPLPPVRRGALHILAGDNATGSSLLAQAATAEKTRLKATWSLALLSGDSQATMTALLLCMKDPRPEVRRMAVAEAQRLNLARAQIVLTQAAQDQDHQIRLSALKALRRAQPSSVMSLRLQLLKDPVPRVRQETLDQLTNAAQSNPVEVFDGVSSAIHQNPKQLEAIRLSLEHLLHHIQQKSPQQVAAHLLEVATSNAPIPSRVSALKRLSSMSQALSPKRVLPVIPPLARDANSQIRAAAIPLQARFGNSDEAMQQLTDLAKIHHPPEEATAMRQAAAIGLGIVPQRVTAERLKLLKNLLTDREAEVRAAAMESLIGLGRVGLPEVIKGIKKRRSDIAIVALTVVCKGTEIKQKFATSILATVWQSENSDLRRRALKCARNLASSNPRLSLWLADQARIDKDPQVRQAAAGVVALTLKGGSGRGELLTRFYLKRMDAPIIVALLQAMQRTPPTASQSLFQMIAPLTRHPETRVRETVAPLVVMTAVRPEQAVPLLKALLQDPESLVTRAAITAAAQLAPTPAAQELDPILSRLISAARSKDALAALDVAKQLHLSGAIHQAAIHPEADVRAASLALLASAADPRQSLSVLESAFRDPEPAIRLAALQAIAQQSDRLAGLGIELLRKATGSSSPNERWTAFDALSQVQGQALDSAVKLLNSMGHHRSEEMRRLAMRSLGGLASRSPDAAHGLINGALDPAFDVRLEARAVLAHYLGQRCPFQLLWEMLLASEHYAPLRHMALSALAHHGRMYGADALKSALSKLSASAPVVSKMAARLALSLVSRTDRPEEVIGWLWGW